MRGGFIEVKRKCTVAAAEAADPMLYPVNLKKELEGNGNSAPIVCEHLTHFDYKGT